MTDRLAYVDMLRGVSMLYIAGFWHLMEYTTACQGYYNAVTLRLTVIILGLFVFLSGWLIGQRIADLREEGFKRFYVRRFLRIYPLYLGAIGLFLACKLTDDITLLKAGLLISMFYGPPPPTLWFITMLILFFLVAPPLVYASKNGIRFLALAGIIFGSLVLIVRLSTAADPRPAIYFPAFACGIYLAHLNLRRFNYAMAFIFVGFLLSVALSFSVENVPEHSFWSTPLACLGPVSIFLLSWRYKHYVPNSRSLVVLAYSSFVIYLIHRPMYVTMKWIYFPPTGNLQFLYLIFVCLPLTVLTSWLIQKTYDAALQLLPMVRSGAS